MINSNEDFLSLWSEGADDMGSVSSTSSSFSWLNDASNDPLMASTWADNQDLGNSPKRTRTSSDASSSVDSASSWRSSSSGESSADSIDPELNNLMNDILSDIDSFDILSQSPESLDMSVMMSEPPEPELLPFDEALLPDEPLEPLATPEIPTEQTDAPSFLVEFVPPPTSSPSEPMVIVKYDPQEPALVQATFDIPEAVVLPARSRSSPSSPKSGVLLQNQVSMQEAFNVLPDARGKTSYHCNLCSGVLRSYKEATKHFRNKHSLYTCSLCEASNFVGYFRMNAHTKKMHKKPSTVHCQCSRGFSSEKGLNKHKLNCGPYQEHMLRIRATLKPTYQFLN